MEKKLSRNLAVLVRDCDLNKWSGKVSLRRWYLSIDAKGVRE